MSEYYPGTPEYGSGGTEKGKIESKKGGSSLEMPGRFSAGPEKIKVAGNEALKAGENFKSLGEIFKPEAAKKPTEPEIPKENLSAESDKLLREVNAEDLRAMAAHDAAAQLARNHEISLELDKEKKSEDDDDDEDEPKNVKAKPAQKSEPEKPKAQIADIFAAPPKESQPEAKTIPETPPEQAQAPETGHEEFDHIMQQNAPELAAAASGENLQAAHEKPEPIGPAAEQNPNQPKETDAAFAAIAGSPELADLAAKQVPESPKVPLDEQAKPEAFDRWVNEHPELNPQELRAMSVGEGDQMPEGMYLASVGSSTPNTVNNAPEVAAASNNDERFNDIVQNSLGGNSPGGTRFFEQKAGQPPLDMGEGGNVPPNFPPTAEGGAWGDGDDLPEGMYRANVGYNSGNVLNNPWAPAGGLAEPATWAAISVMQARQELNNLKHTAAEAGLAGAVGILGLGLVADHLWARRRFRQQNRQIRKQTKEIHDVSKDLKQEQSAHQVTRNRLARVSEAQAADGEQLKNTLDKHHITKVEAGVGGGLAGAVAAADMARKPPERPIETLKVESGQSLQNQEMAWYLENNREAGRAIEKNPELRDKFEAAGAVAAVGAEAGPAAEKPVFNREGTHEQLQNQYLDAAGASKSSSSVESQSVPLPPLAQQPTGTPDFQAAPPLIPADIRPQKQPSKAKTTATGIGIFILIAAIVFFVLR